MKTVVLERLPFAEPERLVMVWETRPDRGRTSNVVSNASKLDPLTSLRYEQRGR